MLEAFMDEEDVLLNVSCGDWQEALDKGAAPLLRRQVIEPSYVEAIKRNHREMPYMVIAPGIMLAHARPECGAKAIGLTLMTLEEPVEFGSELNDPVKLVITLATPDDKSHVKMLEALTEFLMDSDKLEAFGKAATAEEALDIMRKGED